MLYNSVCSGSNTFHTWLFFPFNSTNTICPHSVHCYQHRTLFKSNYIICFKIISYTVSIFHVPKWRPGTCSLFQFFWCLTRVSTPFWVLSQLPVQFLGTWPVLTNFSTSNWLLPHLNQRSATFRHNVQAHIVREKFFLLWQGSNQPRLDWRSNALPTGLATPVFYVTQFLSLCRIFKIKVQVNLTSMEVHGWYFSFWENLMKLGCLIHFISVPRVGKPIFCGTGNNNKKSISCCQNSFFTFVITPALTLPVCITIIQS